MNGAATKHKQRLLSTLLETLLEKCHFNQTAPCRSRSERRKINHHFHFIHYVRCCWIVGAGERTQQIRNFHLQRHRRSEEWSWEQQWFCNCKREPLNQTTTWHERRRMLMPPPRERKKTNTTWKLLFLRYKPKIDFHSFVIILSSSWFIRKKEAANEWEREWKNFSLSNSHHLLAQRRKKLFLVSILGCIQFSVIVWFYCERNSSEMRSGEMACAEKAQRLLPRSLINKRSSFVVARHELREAPNFIV